MSQPVMLITGASRGIGAATAILAARQGYRVVINYRSQAQAAAAVLAEVQAAGQDGCCIQADVAEEEQVLQLFAELDRRYGRLDVLVNNAGILETQMPLLEMSLARWQRVMAANVYGTFLCSREAIKRMALSRGGQGGAIVNVSSLAARLGAPGEYIDYAAAKGAVDTMTVGLAKECAAERIRVNGVRPGFIYTDIHASGGEPGRVDRVKTAVPMQRGGQPEEVAEAILWLASAKASYTSGSFIEVAGGR
ncbi:SDR family oxidoreductase [Balneatrix alpica]|uniref:SDR family oxidoreductase n=1 Tax=Balneatrix alpica TaxID=75684 RepID=A0ABV5ZEY5_9GAMM|nr:SDR family oxidoreductase [Balneatrix alpica]